MKLVISSTGPHPTDRVDPRFGRARFLIQYDSGHESYVSIDNEEQVEGVQGAGVQAARKVADLHAEALLTGRCGPKAFHVLAAAGVLVYSGIEGSVLEAVQAWREGRLEPLDSPDGIAHH